MTPDTRRNPINFGMGSSRIVQLLKSFSFSSILTSTAFVGNSTDREIVTVGIRLIKIPTQEPFNPDG